MKVTEPARPEWETPTNFEPKEDGLSLFFLDHQNFNAVSIGDSYSISRMDECIKMTGEATILSNLNANVVNCQM